MLVRSLKHPFDQTVAGYIATAVSVLLNIALILGILGFFGIETTSLAALMAGVGIAIGAAWGGLLANFAATGRFTSIPTAPSARWEAKRASRHRSSTCT